MTTDRFERLKCGIAVILMAGSLVSCGELSEPLQPNQSNSNTGSYGLFVTSGACYGGGVATSAGSGTVAVLDPDSGALRRILVDYSVASPGDMPVSVTNFDDDHVLVAVENAAGRRLDLVRKDGLGFFTYLSNATALNGVLRAMDLQSDGTLLVAKSTAIEKFAPSKARITQGANPFVNAPGLACATSTTMMVDVERLSNGKILYAHAAASPNNKLGLISATGYAGTADCLSTQAAPATTALPTGLLVHSSGKILVTYGSTVAANNHVYSYDLNVSTNAFSNAAVAFADLAIVNGPSAIAEHPVDGSVYIANAISTYNTIERFTLNPATGVLTRSGSTLGPAYYTRCISSLKVIAE